MRFGLSGSRVHARVARLAFAHAPSASPHFAFSRYVAEGKISLGHPSGQCEGIGERFGRASRGRALRALPADPLLRFADAKPRGSAPWAPEPDEAETKWGQGGGRAPYRLPPAPRFAFLGHCGLGRQPHVSRQRNASGSPREGGKPSFGNSTVKERVRAAQRGRKTDEEGDAGVNPRARQAEAAARSAPRYEAPPLSAARND